MRRLPAPRPDIAPLSWLLSERIGERRFDAGESAPFRQPALTLDRVAGVAARLFSAPVAFIQLTSDRFPRMRPGMAVALLWSEQEVLTCIHSFGDGAGVVPDLRRDPRFRDNPLVERAGGVRACAVVPVRAPEGDALGAICVLDVRPRKWDRKRLEFLQRLAELTGDILAGWASASPPAVALEARPGHQRYRELFDNQSDLVFTHDLRGRITAVNEAAERLLGYPREELVGRDIAELVAPEHAQTARQILLEQVGGGIPANYALSFRTRSGKNAPLDVSTHLLFANGQPIGLMGFGRSATSRNGSHPNRTKTAAHGLLLSNDAALELLENRIQGARDAASKLAVVALEVDHFRLFNEALGTASGDNLLRLTAERIAQNLRPGEAAGRIGTDRFLVVLPAVCGAGEAENRARSFVEQARTPVQLDGADLLLTASAGVAVFPDCGRTGPELARNAEAALEKAKRNGRSGIGVFAAEDGSKAFQLLEMESSLAQALEKNQFQLTFEPLLNMQGAVDGMEALLSWTHPKQGSVPARRFIPIAEATGIIVPIDAWVLERACRQNALWQKKGYPPVVIAVNVSAARFASKDFTAVVARTLESARMEARYLELEVTESAVMQDVARSVQTMSELRKLGVRLAVDDFGTGYSSLSYIQHLPVNTLKIDQSFLQTGPANTALPLIRAMVTLARNFGLAIVAEGVETLDQFDLVRKAGCDKAQGHLFGRSLSKVEAGRLLARHKRGPLWRPIR